MSRKRLKQNEVFMHPILAETTQTLRRKSLVIERLCGFSFDAANQGLESLLRLMHLRVAKIVPRFLHLQINLAGCAGDIFARLAFADQHFARVTDFFVAQTLFKAILKSVGPKIAPEIAAASKQLAIPVDLRL